MDPANIKTFAKTGVAALVAVVGWGCSLLPASRPVGPLPPHPIISSVPPTYISTVEQPRTLVNQQPGTTVFISSTAPEFDLFGINLSESRSSEASSLISVLSFLGAWLFQFTSICLILIGLYVSFRIAASALAATTSAEEVVKLNDTIAAAEEAKAQAIASAVATQTEKVIREKDQKIRAKTSEIEAKTEQNTFLRERERKLNAQIRGVIDPTHVYPGKPLAWIVENLTRQYTETKRELKQDVKDLKDSVWNQSAIIAAKDAELATLSLEKSFLARQVSDLQTKCENEIARAARAKEQSEAEKRVLKAARREAEKIAAAAVSEEAHRRTVEQVDRLVIERDAAREERGKAEHAAELATSQLEAKDKEVQELKNATSNAVAIKDRFENAERLARQKLKLAENKLTRSEERAATKGKTIDSLYRELREMGRDVQTKQQHLEFTGQLRDKERDDFAEKSRKLETRITVERWAKEAAEDSATAMKGLLDEEIRASCGKAELLNQIAELESEYGKLQKRLEARPVRSTDQGKQMAACSNELKKSLRDKKKLLKVVDQLKVSNADLLQDVAALTPLEGFHRLSDTETKSRESDEELVRTLRKEVASLTAAAIASETKSRETASEFETRIRKLQEELNAVNTSNISLQSKVDGLEQERSILRQEIADRAASVPSDPSEALMSEVRRLQEQLNSATATNDEFQQAALQWEAQKQTAGQKYLDDLALKEAECLSRIAQAVQHEQVASDNRMAAKQSEIRSQWQSRERELLADIEKREEDLRNQATAVNNNGKSQDALRKKYDGAVASIKRLEERLHNGGLQWETVRKEAENMQARAELAEEEAKKYKRAKDNMERTIQSRDNEIQSLRATGANEAEHASLGRDFARHNALLEEIGTYGINRRASRVLNELLFTNEAFRKIQKVLKSPMNRYNNGFQLSVIEKAWVESSDASDLASLSANARDQIQCHVLIHQCQAANQRLRDLKEDIDRVPGLEIQERLALLMAPRGDEHIEVAGLDDDEEVEEEEEEGNNDEEEGDEREGNNEEEEGDQEEGNNEEEEDNNDGNNNEEAMGSQDPGNLGDAAASGQGTQEEAPSSSRKRTQGDTELDEDQTRTKYPKF